MKHITSICRKRIFKQMIFIYSYFWITIETKKDNDFTGLECHGGTCKKSLPYFGRDPKFSEAEIKLEECLTFLCLTPFLYIGILAVIEYKFIQKLYARYFMKGSVSSNVEMDEQVREEKYTVGFEVNKLRAECK